MKFKHPIGTKGRRFFNDFFPAFLRNFPDVAFLQFPALCLQGDLRCSSLQSISASPSWGAWREEEITQEVSMLNVT
ncbi:hypothetical protein AV530_007861 [Patagioenas fasciata monilis]|uniref:Uncharacterized protein n=1 Tax=Patagioenas fasciata monilis TaxID=372326 RepID=A0A1V4JUJ8_PATFA|nr:hypothetical protein AV530_007861 [Patagioenas fasciata monilis]